MKHGCFLQRGVTLLELMMTTTALAVLLGIAVPGFSQLRADQRLIAAKHQFQAMVQLARSEAISNGIRVTVCPRAGDVCSEQPHWDGGYLLFVDRNGNRELDAGERLIQERAARADAVTIRSSRYRRRITFQPMGSSGGANLTVTFCDHRGAKSASALVLNTSGRLRAVEPGRRELICSTTAM